LAGLHAPLATGIILAGGRSSRFGTDKASAVYRGRPLLQVACDALGAVCASLVVVAAPGQPLPALSVSRPLDVVYDRVPFQGPLPALAAGFRATTAELALVAAVDLPLLRPALLEFLLSLVAGHDAVVPHVGGRLQPLLAVYRTLPALRASEQTLATGRRAAQDILELLQYRVVAESELVAADPELLSFRNANTPDDLAALATLVVP
jgi:molybdopterin-guanine dinucleotide biosynthesis protein A